MWILPKQISSTISLSAQGTRESDKDSEEFCQMCEKSLMWRSKPSLSRTWSTRLKRGGFIKHLFIRTLKPSLTESFEGWWTSSVEDFPASRFLKLELEKLRKIQDTCSPSSQKESESANLELFSSKMSKESLAAKPQMENQFSNMSSEHWKKWVTEQRQEYLARAKSVHRIKEKESSSWATPNTMDHLQAGISGSYKESLEGRRARSSNLRDQVNFPTPMAEEGGKISGGKTENQDSLTKRARNGQLDPTKNNTNGKPLVSLKLNPNWVEQLMGLPVGWTDLDFLEME